MGLLTDTIRDHIENKHREEAARNASLREMNFKVAFDPNVDDVHREDARANLAKLLHPEARKSLLGKAVPLFDHIRSIAHKKGELPTPDTKEAAAAAEPQQDAPQSFEQGAPVLRLGQGLPTPQTAAPAAAQTPVAVSSQLPTPATAVKRGKEFFDVPSIGTNAERAQLADDAANRRPNAERDRRTRLADENELTGRDRVEFIERGNLPAQLRTGNAKSEQWKLADGKLVDVDFDPVTRHRYFGNEEWEIPEGASRQQAKPGGSGQIRSIPHSVSRSDALKQLETGSVFKDQEGNEIDISKLPENMGLQGMVLGDKMFWTPITPSQKTVTVGNVVYGVTPYEVKDIGRGGGTELGQARTGTTGVSSSIAYDPVTGQPTVNSLPRSTAPNTPGAIQRPAAAPLQPVVTPQGGAPPVTTRSQPLATPATAAPASSPTLPAGAVLRGVPAGQYRAMLERVTPVREAATQVFGDPSQPDLKGLKDYIDLADDPKSRERIGKALRLTFDGISDASHGGSVAVGAGPVHVSTGGIGDWLQYKLGVPEALAKEKSKVIQDAIGAMNPEEQEYYDSVMSAYSTIVGLRSLTKASASESSSRAIEREIPLIGINTQNSRQFADQTQRLAEVVYNGTKGVPKGMFDDAMVERIRTLPGEMQKIKAARGSGARLPKPGDMETKDYNGHKYQRKVGTKDDWKLVP